VLRIRGVYPGSRISDLASWIKKQQQKRIFCGKKYLNFENYFIFELVKKKFEPIYIQRIIKLFTQKIVIILSKLWAWDPGVRKAPYPGYGSATLVYPGS
jgi:hypothetical protein